MGKTLRGTLSHQAPDQRSQPLVALYETQTGVILAQQAVPDKGNEMTVEATLLTPTQVQGRIITADALHTQRTCCAAIHRLDSYYVLLAKGNQPTLEEDLRLFFSERPPIAATGDKRSPGTRDTGGWNDANWLPVRS